MTEVCRSEKIWKMLRTAGERRHIVTIVYELTKVIQIYGQSTQLAVRAQPRRRCDNLAFA